MASVGILLIVLALATGNISADAQDVDKGIGELLATAMNFLNQTLSRLLEQSLEHLHRVEALWDRLTELEHNMISSRLDSNQTLSNLESREQKPPVCERGMNETVSEPFIILADDSIGKQIRCDAHTDTGGWIVFQRRAVGDVDFYRNWTEYRDGFGSLSGDFWLGNEALHKLTKEHSYELRIDFYADGQVYYAQYPTITVEDEENKYRLGLDPYSEGTLGEITGSGLSYSDRGSFSTFDQDNNDYPNVNCAVSNHGAWWWYNGRVHRYATFTEMKMRRV
ncbi:hypothetical protein RRG08_014830 [Elysia crispata]|uniref:Fibrinogen C-terminal domain-containing protein n=1 Tax=Elysia crispata TaxID=231223 RepID=A0AAE0Z594_9GAST|nr:hypothetical protein RRG08_014830 [Elysia crispata]